MLDESKRQRAMRPEVKVSRQALAVVQHLNDRIGEWQASAVRLVALGRHLKAHGSAVSEVCVEAEKLVAIVEDERRALASKLGDLPPAVAASSRILDTDRALQGIVQGLHALVAPSATQRRPGTRHSADRPESVTPPPATNKNP